MASRITAIRKYRPEIERTRTLQMDELVEIMAMRTSLNNSQIRFVVNELQDVLLYAHHNGWAVKVQGLGTFTPTMRANGKIDTLFRSEPAMRRALNDKTRLRARILNKASIGKSADELVAQWNEAHPDDPVE